MKESVPHSFYGKGCVWDVWASGCFYPNKNMLHEKVQKENCIYNCVRSMQQLLPLYIENLLQ